MRAFWAFVFSLPLSAMLMGLLAALVPVPWQSWLVLQLLGIMLLWMLLVVLVAIPERTWPPLVALLVMNGVAWLALQATALYGGGA
ncbi:MAG: hypothetical protein AOY29_05675 [Alcanivorax borkumensis]|jgi:hypothetical protein|nr:MULTISPECIES: hypothetical protein [Alcanivorax]EUC70973.1 hypothetical protein Y017_08370 [Alcanivorax sp. 97CO-5]OJH06817.1 MAG: hypothetical protein AOY29_05675 [Alcanivorax borkumensis]PKG02497.1 hypothetical protein Y019_04170 [Alcanivorax sp. 97CO-6]BAP15449.1 hypothetical protein AS19_25980 [Alcanivorax sp. NBRC 101098]